MSEIKYVEYDETYAEKVADMWKASKKGWNGSVLYESGDAVKRSEASSDRLYLWLALDEDKVVGYCKLSKYKREEALYIDYLNVRDAYHGKKIGKHLVLKCVNETIKKGYNRLDLHTWPGNTEAVPLYKKCGFFWEKNDYSTHCINFIPFLLNDEILKDEFEFFDWYEDSKRKIELKPDGREENKFEYLEYLWEKEGKSLEVEFSRFGRGLRSIKNDDFSVKVSIEKKDLIFNKKYKIKYEFENFTEKEISIKIKGKSNENVEFNFTKEFLLKDKEIIEDEFFVQEIEAEFTEYDVLPRVESEISINENSSIFALGFFPKYPLLVNLKPLKSIIRENVPQTIFWEIESRLDRDCTLDFSLPKIPNLRFDDENIKVDFKPEEKKSVPVKAVLEKAFFFDEEIRFDYKCEDETHSFSKKVKHIFPTHREIIWGAKDKYYEAYIGKYYLYLSEEKSNMNYIYISEIFSQNYVWFTAPDVGMPFNSEFKTKKADEVNFSIENSSLVVKIKYSSDLRKGLVINRILKIGIDGFITYHWILENTGNQSIENFVLKDVFSANDYKVMPYEGEYIKIPDSRRFDLQFADTEKMHEKWLFGEKDNRTISLFWDESQNPILHDYYNSFETKVDVLKEGEKRVINSVTTVFNYFKNWNHLRNYVCNDTAVKSSRDFLDVNINGNNPFYNENIELKISDKTKERTSAEINFYENEMFAHIPKAVLTSNDLNGNSSDLKLNYKSMNYSRKNLLFQKCEGYCKREKSSYENGEIFCLDNGKISFKVATNFAPVIYSLIFNDNEWLDTNFPKSGPKSWENPWFGGASVLVDHMGGNLLEKEKYSVDFCSKTDNFGNYWEGITMEMKFEEFKKLKNCTLKQYFLTQYNQPLLLVYYEFENSSGNCQRCSFNFRNYFKLSERLEDSYIEFKDTQIYAGQDSVYNDSKSCLKGVGKERENFLHIFPLEPENDYYTYQMCNNEFRFGGACHNDRSIIDKDSVKKKLALVLFDNNEHKMEEAKNFNEIIFED